MDVEFKLEFKTFIPEIIEKIATVIEFFAEIVPAIKIVPGMVQEVIPEQEIDIIILHFLMKESSEKRLVRS